MNACGRPDEALDDLGLGERPPDLLEDRGVDPDRDRLAVDEHPVAVEDDEVSDLAGAHRLAISRSTRSSWDLNGSLQRTVRWAWSLSFRCTQSTV